MLNNFSKDIQVTAYENSSLGGIRTSINTHLANSSKILVDVEMFFRPTNQDPVTGAITGNYNAWIFERNTLTS